MNLFLSVATAILVLPGCQSDRGDAAVETTISDAFLRRYAAEISMFDRLSTTLEDLTSSTPMEVFEGLPHPLWELSDFANESRRNDVFSNHKFQFYSTQLDPETKGPVAIMAIARSLTSYTPWTGPKLCGGFHPDLLVRFHSSSGLKEVHICLGCHEAMIYTNGGAIHVDLQDGAASKLEVWQKVTQTKRPKKTADLDNLRANNKGCIAGSPSEPATTPLVEQARE